LGSSNAVFVATGTHVQLVGHAKVRQWDPDCSFDDYDCRSIVWTLFYQPVNGGVTNVTSVLLRGPQSNPNSFDAGLSGRFRIILGCPELALRGSTVATRNIFVGPCLKLDSVATVVWIQNSLAGLRKWQNVEVHAVLVEAPPTDQVLLHINPITVSKIVVTQQDDGQDGTFDSTSGTLKLHFIANINGQVSGTPVSGTADIRLSTDENITPPGEPGPISGTRRGGDGSVVLVGNAPVDGLPGTTHAWLQVSGTLTAV
jgi:hypothetical protein